MNRTKTELYNHINGILNDKINALIENIKSATESKNSDTKSSAGDKFETGREMIQIEINKLEQQLSNTRKLKNDLNKINIEKDFSSVEFGSIVITNKGNYFISIGIGKIEINNKYYYAVSLASPIGKALYNKHENNEIVFNNDSIKIIKIY